MMLKNKTTRYSIGMIKEITKQNMIDMKRYSKLFRVFQPHFKWNL